MKTLKHTAGISDRVLVAGSVCVGLTDAFVLSNAWLVRPSWNLFMLAVPVSQCILVAAWAAVSKANLGMRFVLPLLTMLVSWKMVQHILALPFESMMVTQWMIVFTWVVSIVVAGARAHQILEETENSGAFWTNTFRVELKTMMMLTFAAGIAFAFIQYGRVHWQWSIDGLRPRDTLIFNLLGLLTGIQSLTCLGMLVTARLRKRLSRLGLHLAGLATCSLLFGYCVTPTSLAESVQETLTFWLSSNAMIIPVVMIGRWLSAKLAPESQSGTTLTSQ